MDGNVQEIVIPSVYEYLLALKGVAASDLDSAAMMAGYRPVYQGNQGWDDLSREFGDRMTEFKEEGLELIGICQDDRPIGFCGYRMMADPVIIIRGCEVELPYELFIAVNGDVDIGADLIYSAQMFITNHEDLKLVKMDVIS